MNLDVVPETPLERLAMALGVVPSPVVRILWSVALFRVVLPALELGVFEAMEDGDATPEDVAKKTGCHEEGMRALLAALNGFGYLRRKGGRYSLAPATRKWMLNGAPNSMRAALEFASTLDEMMSKIPEAVRTGKRGGLHQEPHSSEWWRRYLEGLGAVSKLTGAEIARRLDLDEPRSLLDVGGGHGMYSAALCRRHPKLKATVLDLPEAARIGRALVAREGLSDRIGYREGDLRTADWGRGHDVVFLFNILHNLESPEAQAALKKAKEALAPGGTLAILDGEHAGGDGDLNAAEGFGELFFFAVSASSTWPEPTLRQWLEQAGFSEVKRMRLFTFPSTLCLLARVRAEPAPRR